MGNQQDIEKAKAQIEQEKKKMQEMLEKTLKK